MKKNFDTEVVNDFGNKVNQPSIKLIILTKKSAGSSLLILLSFYF